MNRGVPDPVILIHGAWQGSWVWDRIIPTLARSAGITSVAIDLPGNGTDGTKAADVSLDLYVDPLGAPAWSPILAAASLRRLSQNAFPSASAGSLMWQA
jgi:pimeloyl-ACP methyl ester carboxylesterase